MSYSFNDNMSLSLNHEMRVRELIGRSTVLPAHLSVDKSLGKDLMIFSDATGHGVAARVRRANDHGAWEFTIRRRGAGGGDSEYHKFRAGMCRLMFYGVLNKHETDFDRWMLFSLDVWRSILNKRDAKKEWHVHSDSKRNSDGSEFLVYNADTTRFRGATGFMIDCSNYDYMGRVAMRQYRREKGDAIRFSRRVA